MTGKRYVEVSSCIECRLSHKEHGIVEAKCLRANKNLGKTRPDYPPDWCPLHMLPEPLQAERPDKYGCVRLDGTDVWQCPRCPMGYGPDGRHESEPKKCALYCEKQSREIIRPRAMCHECVNLLDFGICVDCIFENSTKADHFVRDRRSEIK